MKSVVFAVMIVLLSAGAAAAQDAELAGLVKDGSGAVVPKATLKIISKETGTSRSTQTNASGLYVFASLKPGGYDVDVSAQGFKKVTRSDLRLEVAQRARLDFTLDVGKVEETVTVTAGHEMLQTRSAAVRTVITGDLANQLPLNGQTLQSLLSLSPGVAVAAAPGTFGDFSISGQRGTANTFEVDGLNATLGTVAQRAVTTSLSGVTPAESAAGTTGPMASFESLREIEIQTSVFAPEYGRTPGGQISLSTKAGTREFHGSAFGYFRHETLNANDWFAIQNGLTKPKERYRNAGGSLGGPVRFDTESTEPTTFFFLSYEDYVLDQPKVGLYSVPTAAFRATANSVFKAALNSFPLPNGPANPTGNGAAFNLSYTNALASRTISARIDQNAFDHVHLYVRYNHSPSSADIRNTGTPQAVDSTAFGFDSVSGSAVWFPSSSTVIDTRINGTWNRASGVETFETLGGAVPFEPTQLFSSANAAGATFSLGGFAYILSPDGFTATGGSDPRNRQRQAQVVSAISHVHERHSFKGGVDIRLLRPVSDLQPTFTLIVQSLANLQNGRVDRASIVEGQSLAVGSNQFSAYLQDEWRVRAPLVITYGIRWDINPAPYARNGLSPLTLTNFRDVAQTDVVKADRVYATEYGKVAPRVGIAWAPIARFVVRGGAGVFDGSGFVPSGNLFSAYPYSYATTVTNTTVPVTIPGFQWSQPTTVKPPYPSLFVAETSFKLPTVTSWDASIETALTTHDAFTATYVGNRARHLTSEKRYPAPNTLFAATALVNVLGSEGSSSYQALQLKYDRRLSHGIQALASYTWSHATDTVSRDIDNTLDKGPALFDIHHIASFAVISTPRTGTQLCLLGRIQSAPPLDITLSGTVFDDTGHIVIRRPDVAAGIPIWIDDPSAGGGRRLNPAAFLTPPAGVQGNLPRNSIRGFGLQQFDAGISQVLARRHSANIALRLDAFNVFNHPNFAQPATGVGTTAFGRSKLMANGTPTGEIAGATLASPFAAGGPRTLQVSVRVSF